ncbi:MAG: hypothetical protein ACTSR0_06460 [Candidatus Asgardarchaeia archaeon]
MVIDFLTIYYDYAIVATLLSLIIYVYRINRMKEKFFDVHHKRSHLMTMLGTSTSLVSFYLALTDRIELFYAMSILCSLLWMSGALLGIRAEKKLKNISVMIFLLLFISNFWNFLFKIPLPVASLTINFFIMILIIVLTSAIFIFSGIISHKISLLIFGTSQLIYAVSAFFSTLNLELLIFSFSLFATGLLFSICMIGRRGSYFSYLLSMVSVLIFGLTFPRILFSFEPYDLSWYLTISACLSLPITISLILLTDEMGYDEKKRIELLKAYVISFSIYYSMDLVGYLYQTFFDILELIFLLDILDISIYSASQILLIFFISSILIEVCLKKEVDFSDSIKRYAYLSYSISIWGIFLFIFLNGKPLEDFLVNVVTTYLMAVLFILIVITYSYSSLKSSYLNLEKYLFVHISLLLVSKILTLPNYLGLDSILRGVVLSSVILLSWFSLIVWLRRKSKMKPINLS